MRALLLSSMTVMSAALFTGACAGDDEGPAGDGDAGDGEAGDGDAGDGDTGDGDTGDGDGDSVTGDGDGDGDSPGDGDGDGDGDSSGDGDGQTEIPTIPTVASNGCGTVDPPTGTQAILVGDVSRTYIVDLPDDYDPDNPHPVIFGFHGRGGSAQGASGQWYLGLGQQGGKPSILVYPDGLDDGMGTGWPNSGGQDVAFFDALLAELKASYCVDENRVFSTGHSYGGMMSFTLACERASDVRAVAPVAGARWSQSACTGPIAALGIHGNPDDTVGYDLGLSAIGRILEANGCDENSTASYDPTEFCTSYACDTGYPVVWCEHQDGHNWPNFAAATIKQFFDRF
jgi:polyhydroxybutyrate depolymerase